ncbi:MAG: IS5 family transposase [Chloroflexi bacterium]|nr:IS5 family transposase [Chloroflexota bacterium]MYD16900.1 IS5 family transposase [Chloroflexota bacterium]MYJ00782.1 IS5 family transposase [Chloroflexota bacterium]
MARHKLTSKQWKTIEPLLPGQKSHPGRSGHDNRKALEGMIWVLRTGAPWRDLPSDFGKWGTVYQRFRRWSNAGVFERIFEETQGEVNITSIQIDGSHVKVHQHGTGAPKAEAPLNTPSGLSQLGEPEVG